MRAYDWDALRLGVAVEFSVTVTPEMIDRFRDDTGDTSPLHVDAAYARNAGFRDRVAHGLLTASFFSTLVGVHLPGSTCLLHGINATFHAPVYPEDRLTVRGEVAYRNEACRQAELRCSITNQHGARVATAKLKVGVR